MKPFNAFMRRIDGRTGDPNSPSMVATRKNIFSPPPSAIECLLRLNQQEARKQIPLMANITRNAPRLMSSSFA